MRIQHKAGALPGMHVSILLHSNCCTICIPGGAEPFMPASCYLACWSGALRAWPTLPLTGAPAWRLAHAGAPLALRAVVCSIAYSTFSGDFEAHVSSRGIAHARHSLLLLNTPN